MGAKQSKNERLYNEVKNGRHFSVKALHRDGATLEWRDKKGQTPLLLACSKRELLDMAMTLLDLGANLNAFMHGKNGGFPLHAAARNGLEKTVTLLISHGADPWAVNDDSDTPLDIARRRGHVGVVRLLEEHICLFNGVLREISGPKMIQSFVPNLVTKKIWAVVLPSKSNPTGHELLIYKSAKDCQPHTTISLSIATIAPKEPLHTSKNQPLYLHVTDTAKRMKYKFFPEKEGDSDQFEFFYKACKGISQDATKTTPTTTQGDHPSLIASAPDVDNATTSAMHSSSSSSSLSSSMMQKNHSVAPLRPPTRPPPPPPSSKEPGDSEGMCVICLDALAQVACVPCGHLAGCVSCMSEIEGHNRQCPVCRTPIDQVVKVYIV